MVFEHRFYLQDANNKVNGKLKEHRNCRLLKVTVQNNQDANLKERIFNQHMLQIQEKRLLLCKCER